MTYCNFTITTTTTTILLVSTTTTLIFLEEFIKGQSIAVVWGPPQQLLTVLPRLPVIP